MKWIEYPTRDAFRRKDGQPVEGQKLSPAPGGTWAVAPGRKIHLVKTSHGESYCIREECPR